MLERPCLLQLRAEDERIQTALVDDDELLLAAKGVTFRYPLVLIVNLSVLFNSSINSVAPCLPIALL